MLKKVKLNSFVKNILKIFTGSLIVKLIGFASLAVLARLYSPEDFGFLELALSIAGIALAFSSLRYEQAIVIPENDEDAVNICAFTIFLLFAVCGVMSAGIYFCFNYLDMPTFKSMGAIAYAIPALLLFRGIKDHTSYWFFRKKRFARSSLSDVAARLVEVTLKIALPGLLAWGLMIGNIGGFLAGGLVLYFFVFRMDVQFFHQIKFARIKENLKKYKNFPLYQFPSQLFKILTEKIPALLLAPFFGFTVVGFYSLGFKLINEPLSILGQSIGNVYYQEVSSRHAKNTAIQKLVEEVFEKLLVVSLVPILFLSFKGKSLFALFLGEKWRMAGYYTELLAPMLLFRFIAIPLSFTLYVLNEQKTDMIFNFSLLLSSLASFLLGAYFNSVTIALLSFSLANSIIYMIMIATILFISGISPVGVFLRTKVFIAAAIPIITGFVLLRIIPVNDIISLAIGTILCGLYYLFVLIYFIKTGRVSSMISIQRDPIN